MGSTFAKLLFSQIENTISVVQHGDRAAMKFRTDCEIRFCCYQILLSLRGFWRSDKIQMFAVLSFKRDVFAGQ